MNGSNFSTKGFSSLANSPRLDRNVRSDSLSRRAEGSRRPPPPTPTPTRQPPTHPPPTHPPSKRQPPTRQQPTHPPPTPTPTMRDHPSLDGFPVNTWGGVGGARVLQRSARESLPPTATLNSKLAYRDRRKLDGSRFLHSTGEGAGKHPSPFRTSSNMTSGVGKFHLLMANQMFQRRLETAKNVCVDDYVTVDEVVQTPKSVKTTFDIEISEVTSGGDKSVNQTLKDAEAILNMY